MDEIKQAFENFIKGFGTNLLEAVAFIMLGVVVIKLASRFTTFLLQRSKVEGTAASFIVSIINAILSILLFFVVLKIFKINTSNIVAIIAASGLALGLILQDSISNIASGIVMLFTKPFKEDDHIVINSTEGKVKKIKITTTELLTFDNITISIPNTKVITSEIKNYSVRSIRRCELVFPVSYHLDFENIKNILNDYIANEDKILKTPEHYYTISSFGAYSAECKLRVWVKNEDYWKVYLNFNEKLIKLFNENNLDLPLNKMNVVINNKNVE